MHALECRGGCRSRRGKRVVRRLPLARALRLCTRRGLHLGPESAKLKAAPRAVSLWTVRALEQLVERSGQQTDRRLRAPRRWLIMCRAVGRCAPVLARAPRPACISNVQPPRSSLGSRPQQNTCSRTTPQTLASIIERGGTRNLAGARGSPRMTWAQWRTTLRRAGAWPRRLFYSLSAQGH